MNEFCHNWCQKAFSSPLKLVLNWSNKVYPWDVNPWLFHFNVWQNSLQIKKEKKKYIHEMISINSHLWRKRWKKKNTTNLFQEETRHLWLLLIWDKKARNCLLTFPVTLSAFPNTVKFSVSFAVQDDVSNKIIESNQVVIFALLQI